MSKKLRALQERKQQLVSAANAITKKAEDEKRDLSEEERASVQKHVADLKTVNSDIETQRELDAAAASMPGIDVNDPTNVGNAQPVVLTTRNYGFETFGHFAHDVRAGGRSERMDTLRAAAPTVYGQEAVGADGGYAVPPQYATEITRHSLDEDALLPATDELPVEGNSMVFPKDETTPWGTDGVRVYWEAEASEATKTKPKMGVANMRLNKLFGIVPMTDELLEDAPAMGGYLQTKLGESIRWKSSDSIVHGTGAGMPLGILKSDALVVVPKEAGQAAATLLVKNVANMYARMPASSLGRAVWQINSEVLPQLITMVLNDQPIFTAPGGIPNAPSGLLLGRPIRITEHCNALGAVGDIIFADWKRYRTVTKRSGVQLASSVHLYFDAGVTAFRATFRLDGQPALSKPIDPARGAAKKSYFVALEAR